MVKPAAWARKVIDKGLWEPLNFLLAKRKVILPKYKHMNEN